MKRGRGGGFLHVPVVDTKRESRFASALKDAAQRREVVGRGGARLGDGGGGKGGGAAPVDGVQHGPEGGERAFPVAARLPQFAQHRPSPRPASVVRNRGDGLVEEGLGGGAVGDGQIGVGTQQPGSLPDLVVGDARARQTHAGSVAQRSENLRDLQPHAAIEEVRAARSDGVQRPERVSRTVQAGANPDQAQDGFLVAASAGEPGSQGLLCGCPVFLGFGRQAEEEPSFPGIHLVQPLGVCQQLAHLCPVPPAGLSPGQLQDGGGFGGIGCGERFPQPDRGVPGPFDGDTALRSRGLGSRPRVRQGRGRGRARR